MRHGAWLLALAAAGSVVFAGEPAACSPTWAPFDVNLGASVASVLVRHPNARSVTKDGAVHEIRLSIELPFEQLEVSEANIKLGVTQGAMDSIQATLRGGVGYDQLLAYLESRLGKPRGPHQSRHRSWWGNSYCRLGPWWSDGCGSSIAVEDATPGHRLSPSVTKE